MKRQNGFSLIELVMVMVVIGILAVMATPRLGNLSTYSLTSATADLLEAIRYAQQQSMSHSGAANFEVMVTGTGFTVTQNGASITNPITGASGYSQESAVWDGISITSATGTITFDSRGRPTCGGGLPPCALANVTLTLELNGESKTVTIERYTGYAYSS
jgi:prepilin-type N-terminal cleavage/methylation domain-containing protein